MTQLVLIAAVARNGVIGRNGDLPWRLPDDLKHFKALTLGHPILMGRRTWDSLGRPLPGRRNIVISRTPGWRADGAEGATSLDDALALVADAPQAFVIGGAQLYAQALPLADALELTEIDHDVDGDTHFPEWDRSAFVETARSAHTAEAGWPYAFVSYARRAV